MIGSRPRFAIAAATALAVAIAAVPAVAETVQKAGVRVAVRGSLSPLELPRSGSAPVAFSVAGRITAIDPGTPPKLQRIRLEINRHGRLASRAIPFCRLGRIDPSTTAEAIRACGPSLIGEGRFSADVRISDQSPFPSRGKVLAFNGKLLGRRAIFAHIYGTRPVPTSYVLPFSIENGRGRYGTVLTASLPRVTGEWGYVRGLSLRFQPRFLSAGCPAPPGFSRAVFPLLRSSFSFAGGPNLTSTLTRSCKASE